MQKEETLNYYLRKVKEIDIYIQENLDKDLNVRTLAEKSNISFFHFHRIVKAVLNEPLGNYINKIRLDSAIKLIRTTNKSLIEIAENVGYNDLSAFSKAFIKAFGIAPTIFRNDETILLNTHIDYSLNENNKIETNIKPKIITISDKRVCCIQVIGEYGNEETYKAWDELEVYAKKNKLFGWRPELFAVYYDDPDVVDIDNCRADLCISTKKVFKTEGRIESKTITGGKYAVFRYKGPYEYLWNLYDTIYKEWILSTNLKIRDLPSIEKYLNYSHNTKPADLLTEIYLPIE